MINDYGRDCLQKEVEQLVIDAYNNEKEANCYTELMKQRFLMMSNNN